MQLDVDRRWRRTKRQIAVGALRLMSSGRYSAYQPVFLDGKQIVGGDRPTDQRLDAILSTFADAGVSTVLDLGSAEGYITRRCAEAGMPALGVEWDTRRLMLAQWSTSLDAVADLGFWRMRITPETVARLPEVDGTVFLSVLHHQIYEHGLDYGKAMLKAIRAKTRGVMVFEMGDSSETSATWARELPDMGSDPHGWIAELLTEVGFRDVRKLLEVSAWKSDQHTRATFVAH